MREWADNYKECLRFAKDFLEYYLDGKVDVNENFKTEKVINLCCIEKDGLFFKICNKNYAPDGSTAVMYPELVISRNNADGYKSGDVQFMCKIEKGYLRLYGNSSKEKRTKMVWDKFREKYEAKNKNLYISMEKAKKALKEYWDMLIPIIKENIKGEKDKLQEWAKACKSFFGETVPEPEIFQKRSCKYYCYWNSWFSIYEPDEERIGDEASDHYEFCKRERGIGKDKRITIEVHMQKEASEDKKENRINAFMKEAAKAKFIFEKDGLGKGRARYQVDLKGRTPKEIVEEMANVYNGTIGIFKKLTAGNVIEDKIEKALMYNPQIVLTGAPGTGKTYSARKFVAKKLGWDEMTDLNDFLKRNSRFTFVQFHSGYDYTDFVQGYKPKTDEKDKTKMTFELTDGIFKQFCDVANKDQENDYYFIIDEINRADLSRVFGELFFGLEKGYRGTPMITQYGSTMIIPKNVKIIGTMNDVDRGVETIDFALRRRFIWIEVEASMSEHLAGKLQANMKALNKAVYEKLGAEYEIGGAYFKDETDQQKIWNNRIKPLLNEYLRGKKDKQTILEKFRKRYLLEEEQETITN